MAGLFEELKRRNVVRVGVAYVIVGWVAVQIAEVLFDAFGTPDWVIKTVIVLIALGFPFALLFAWAFELTPEGLKKTREVDVSESITPKTGQRLNYVIIASLLVALGYFVWERQAREMSTEIPVDATAGPVEEAEPAAEAEPVGEITQTARRSIAVLPFVNMSSDQEQEWYADGLTEEILNSLAKAPDLLVAARTSSFAFKGSAAPIVNIANELGVDHVLEGSVRRGAEQIRITAQLIRADDGFHLWSETYDRKLEDVISVQEDIAIEIANALETAMDPEALAEMMDVGTGSVPAYEAYLKGIGAIRASDLSGDPYDSLAAIESFDRAVEIDPGFSRAHFSRYFFWALQLQTNQLRYGITELSADEIRGRRDSALEDAIKTTDDPVELLNYEAEQAWNDYNYVRALRLKQRYVEERPNDRFSFGGMINLMRTLGKHREAAEAIQRRYEEEPELSRELANQSLQGLRVADYSDLMRAIAHEAAEKFPDNVALMYQAHRQLLWAGDIDGASRLVPRILASNLPQDNLFLVELRQACAENRLADARRLYEDGLNKYRDDLALHWLASMIMSDDETAASLMDEYDDRGDFETIDSYLSYAHFDPRRYENFMQRVAGQGFEQREIIPLPYRCRP